MADDLLAWRGEIFDLLDDPATAGPKAARHLPDGLLVVRDGLVEYCGPARKSPHAKQAVRFEGLLVPGLVDTHVHFPQLAVMAAPGTELMEWLHKYTFPAEAAFADPDHCEREATKFVDAMLAAGTTTALAFATSHLASANALFIEAGKRNLRLITGRTLSDRNVPEALRDSPGQAMDESVALIKAWHNKGRLRYAVTPRFAPTSTASQLEKAGQLLAVHDDVLLHTHLAENHAEIALVAELFGQADGYLDVYSRAGLVTDRSVFAHSIHLADGDWRALAAAGSALAFCPCSNLFLGSGLFDVGKALAMQVGFAFGSDVGGGNSLSMLRVMDEAYKVARLGGSTLDPFTLWHRATLGGARALRLDGFIGNFAVGKEADFIILDPAAMPLLANRLQATQSVAEALFAYALLGDERIVREVYIMGRLAAGTALLD